MPIATIGKIVKVTPQDELQIVRGKGDWEVIDDKTPFKVRVADIIHENGVVIGVSGPVISGPERYHGLIATLLTRWDNSQWESDKRSGVNFKVGRSVARRVPEIPHSHPEGTEMVYPFIMRYGTIEAEE